MAVSLKLNKTIVNLKTKISYTIAYNEKLKYYCTKCWEYKGDVTLNVSVMDYCKITDTSSIADNRAIKNRFGGKHPGYLKIKCQCEKCNMETIHIGIHDDLGHIIRKLNLLGIDAREDYDSTSKGIPKIIFSDINDIKYFNMENANLEDWNLEKSESDFSLILNTRMISKKHFDDQFHYEYLRYYVDYYLVPNVLSAQDSPELIKEILNPVF